MAAFLLTSVNIYLIYLLCHYFGNSMRKEIVFLFVIQLVFASAYIVRMLDEIFYYAIG